MSLINKTNIYTEKKQNEEDSKNVTMTESMQMLLHHGFNGSLNNSVMMKYEIYYNLSHLLFITGAIFLLYKIIHAMFDNTTNEV